MVQETVEIDPDVNPMDAPPPIDDGKRRFKLMLDTKSFEQSETKDKGRGSQPFIKCLVVAECAEEGEFKGQKVFLRLNTLVFDGRSEMGFLTLQALGGNKNEDAREYVKGLNNYILLAKGFKETMASEPIIKISTQWMAQYKDKDGNYKTVKSGQKNFPGLGGGKFKHIVTAPNGEEVAAQAVPVGYFPDGD